MVFEEINNYPIKGGLEMPGCPQNIINYTVSAKKYPDEFNVAHCS
jgi:hypothetical protein